MDLILLRITRLILRMWADVRLLRRLNKQVILLRVPYGLCNALLATSSTLAIARSLNKPVILTNYCRQYRIVQLTEALEILDDDLERAAPIYVDLVERLLWAHNSENKSRKMYARLILKFAFKKVLHFPKSVSPADIPQAGRTLITHATHFYPSDLVNLSYLRPIKSVQTKIDGIKQQMSDNSIGIHIRRLPGETHWHERGRLEDFIEAMTHEVEADPNVKFYVACTDERTKEDLVQKFGTKIITYNPNPPTRKNSPQSAAVDLYALSATKKIIGTYYSSFSVQAALITGIPLFYATKDGLVERDLAPFTKA